jgi:hypothetical protein
MEGVNMDQSSDIYFEVMVRLEERQASIFGEESFLNLTVKNLDRFRPSADRCREVAHKLELEKTGIAIHHIGEFSISASCSRDKFELFFSTKLDERKLDAEPKTRRDYRYLVPVDRDKKPTQVNIPGGFEDFIEKAYIQHDPIFFASDLFSKPKSEGRSGPKSEGRTVLRPGGGILRGDERPVPPFWNDKFRLRVPTDVAQIMGASSVHRTGITGNGVTVAMPDTGFYYHPYFIEQGYNFLAIAAPDAIDHTSDKYGHGTGECANLLATAPGINFIGIKMQNPTLAFKTAVDMRPDIITCSWGYNVDRPDVSSMPNWVKPLHLAVLDAVSKGITVCFSAGNGHYGFPGSMPEVISVGGTVVTENLTYAATRYSSGFKSTWFPGRRTPDVCGLCGTERNNDYIVLPVQLKAELERENGWGAFSGTSAAAPMVAGVCALLKQADPGLTGDDIKNILKFTARDITEGINAHGKKAAAGPDDATGFGLVNAERALAAIL